MNHLIPSKISAPLLREGIIERKPLVEKLNNGLIRGNRIFLVTSLAGSGKTTLVSQWINEAQLPIAWVSLDAGDNNLQGFWEYIIYAFRSVSDDIGFGLRSVLHSLDEPWQDNIINMLIRDISDFKQQVILVLDDYHEIINSEVHTSLDYFLNHIPNNLHLVIISREKPPLCLSRLRANLNITDISYSELRFSQNEIYNLLKDYLDISLDISDVKRLEELTEGWIAGIQMATLSLESLDSLDKHRFVTEFVGDDRYVFDYMAEVVLGKQSQGIKDFLIKTSIMDRLCASLCNELLKAKDSQSILERLERSNLFLFSVDNKREWFRYHNLFSDFLRRQLMQESSEQEVQELYFQIISWCEKNDLVHEAIAYAMKSKLYDRASELIEHNLWNTFYRSETQLVFGWLKELPATYVESSPLLSAAYANCLLLANREMIKKNETRVLIEYWLKNAEANIDKFDLNRSMHREYILLPHYIRKLRIYYALFSRSDLDELIRMTLFALEELPENELMFRCAMMYALGRAYFLSGDMKAAIDAFENVRQIGKESGDWLNVSAAIEHMADIMYRRGCLIKAADICNEGIAYIRGLSRGHMVPFSGTIYYELGKIQFETGKLDKAEESIRKSIELLSYTSAGQHQQWGYILLAYIYQAYLDTSKAMQMINEAVCYWIQGGDEVSAHRARLCLMAADSDITLMKDAEQWLKEQSLDFIKVNKTLKPDIIHYTAIRVLIDMYRLKLIPPVYDWNTLMNYLNHQQLDARSCDCITWEIEVLVLKTKLMYVQGDIDKSMIFFHEALEIGERSGCVGVFINEGQQILPQLSVAIKRKIKPRFIQHVMESLSELWGVHYESLINYRKEGILKEPLSIRELEILRLIALGYSNREISEELVITVYTVKSHVYHIFEKFNVNNRTQAIVIGRELELIN